MYAHIMYMYMYVITIVYIHEIEEIHVHVGQSKCTQNSLGQDSSLRILEF